MSAVSDAAAASRIAEMEAELAQLRQQLALIVMAQERGTHAGELTLAFNTLIVSHGSRRRTVHMQLSEHTQKSSLLYGGSILGLTANLFSRLHNDRFNVTSGFQVHRSVSERGNSSMPRPRTSAPSQWTTCELR